TALPRLAVLFVLSGASSHCPDLNLIHYIERTPHPVTGYRFAWQKFEYDSITSEILMKWVGKDMVTNCRGNKNPRGIISGIWNLARPRGIEPRLPP
ncbi:hypothetical protein, partial [Neisseria gonorrhoeae]